MTAFFYYPGLVVLLMLGFALPSLADEQLPRNSAALALLEQATQDLNAGQLDQASADLERALRIEPDNATLWHYLGQTRLHQGKYQEAEAFAAKSNILAKDDPALRARNSWLINATRQAGHQNIAPAAVDTREMQALQQKLNEEAESRRRAEQQVEALKNQLDQRAVQASISRPVEPVSREPQYRDDFDYYEKPKKHHKHNKHKKLSRIPKGHRPPKGLCRIWFPGVPPGHQPPPDECRVLKNHVPEGAWLVRS